MNEVGQWLPEDLENLPPGPELAALLASVDRRQLCDKDRVRLAQARNRLVAHLQGELLADLYAVSLEEEPSQQALADPRAASRYPYAEHEIGFALRWTRTAAGNRLEQARALIEDLPAVQAALAGGGGQAERPATVRVPPYLRPAYAEGRQEIDPAEAVVVRELFTRLGAGDSLRSITRDFAARGIRSRTGRTLSLQYLRQWAIRASYAGRRVHRPNSGGPVTVTEATWPALVDPVLFDRVQQILSDPSRKTRRPGRANHLLSLIAVCDVCGDGLIATCRRRGGERAGVWELRCRAGNHVAVPEAELDAYAERVMFAYLARDDVAEQLRAAAAGPELDQVRVELAEVRRQLDELYEQVAARKVTAAALAAIEPKLIAEADQLEARRQELSAPPALAGLIAPGKGAKRRWAKMPMSAKREVARLMLCPDLLGQLRVARCQVRGRPETAEQRVVWRTGSSEEG